MFAICLAGVATAPYYQCEDRKNKFKIKIGGKIKRKKCKWVAKKKTDKRCKKKTVGNKDIEDFCPFTCGTCEETEPPTEAPTDAPANDTPIGTPTASPTKASTVPPTGSPPTGSGCCTINFKECVNYCGDTYDSCMSCGDERWMPDGPPDDPNCVNRWVDCHTKDDLENNGCCPGLTCQGDEWWKQCMPEEDDPTVPTPTAPQPTPTVLPQPTLAPAAQIPTAAPTISPVSPPSSDPPTPAPVVPSGPTGPTPVATGKATWYEGAIDNGACGYKDLPQATFPMEFGTAIGGTEFNDGYGCGACYEVTCVGNLGNQDCSCGNSDTNTVIVWANDKCPGCSTTHFDLHHKSFIEIVAGQTEDMASTCGVLEITYRRVSCDFQGNIKIRSKDGTTGWWYGLHIDDVAGYGAISSIKLREESLRLQGLTSFDIVCDKSNGPSYWACQRPNGRVLTAPMDVQLTDSNGRVLEANGVIKNLDGDKKWDIGTNYDPMD